MCFIDDLLFEPRTECRWKREVGYFGTTAVTAFFEQTLRGDVDAEVVAVSIDPYAARIELAL